MKRKFHYIILAVSTALFTGILLTAPLFSAEKEDEEAKVKVVEKKEEQKDATTDDMKVLLEKFSKRNQLDILTAIREKNNLLEKKEFELESQKQILDKGREIIIKKLDTIASEDDKTLKRIQELSDKFDVSLARMEKKIEYFDKKMDKREADRLNKIVADFKEIKAKKAAEIVPNMDKNLAVQVLLKLPARTAGQILQNMNPKLAGVISELMSKEKKKKMELENNGATDNGGGNGNQ